MSEYDIDALFGDEEEETPAATQKNPVAEQRKHIKELEKRLKEAEPELDILRKFKQEYDASQRESSIQEVFSELGVAEHAAKFYKLENPEGEVTKEAVAAWAVENQFASADSFSDVNKTDQGFTPTSHGESFATGIKQYNRKEWDKLLSTGNPADLMEANKAVEQGRVDLDRVE